MSVKVKAILELIQMMQSAVDQYEDDLIKEKELEQRISRYFADYKGLKGIGSLEIVLPFGKEHKGKKVYELPTEYMQWLIEQEWLEEKFKKVYDAIIEELKDRGVD